jgi:hypothetical protein
MSQFKKMMTDGWPCLFFLIIFLFSVSVTAAQNRVVVVPLFDDPPAIGPPAPVPKTGQTATEEPGDDGDLQMGVSWPNPRFTDNGNGTVTDNLTGLTWLKNTNCTAFFKGDSTGQNDRDWNNALTASNSLEFGFCGLTDGFSAGDWRLPNVRELSSLIHNGVYDPAVPNTAGTGKWTEGDPFTGVQSSNYWSSTTLALYTNGAWHVLLGYGSVDVSNKVGNFYYVWPVRGGND